MVHEEFMRLALKEAEKGCGWVNPNPMVGAVIVKDGRVIGRGHHERCGGNHAEVNALLSCDADPAGSTMYVTLEPCCHFGKTPPCTGAIVKSGVSTVVVGAVDPNPAVAGRGIAQLRESGVRVVAGVLKEECERQNEVHFYFIRERTPYVVMKYAMTLDGKVATASGLSRWITGKAAREHVHRSRHMYSAVMVGVGTVIADDPLLTCRLPGCRNPVRVVCDTGLRIPLDSRIAKTAFEVLTIIATAAPEGEKANLLREMGAEILPLPASGGLVDLKALMRALGGRGIDSVLLEGGPTLNASALESGIVSKVQAYVAPKIFGGKNAPSPVSGAIADSPDRAVLLRDGRVTALGDDVLLEYRVR